ncbi:MAG: histidinol dehydrogenase [Gemmatimonadaceae bacterium]
MTTAVRSDGLAAVRFTGRIADLDAGERARLIARSSTTSAEVTDTVARIIADVRARGDEALRASARQFEGVQLDTLEVPARDVRRALDSLEPDARRALDRAATNIASVQRAFAPRATETCPEPGIVVGRRPDPLQHVGIYAPGGRAVYPSSVLMAAIPARIAGVPEVILASPPRRTGGGRPADAVLAAAALAGVDRVFALGGAGAIAAMALGTRSVPRVDRVVGPGNAYVAAAKVALSSEVGIDCAAGPSELLIIADASVCATRIVDEMVAQAEHDPHACVVAVLLDANRALPRDVERELTSRLASVPRRDIVRQALLSSGAIVVADSLDEAVAFANEYAPEHLLLALRDADAVLSRIRCAGTVFIGPSTSVAFGDYMTGANHVLPTGGSARWSSGLSPLDFVRWTTWQRVDQCAAASLAPDVALLARFEDLPSHARAARSAGGAP